MAELERELRALGALVELPPERDLVAGVGARIAAEPRRRLRFRYALGAVVAALAVALGVAFAVPPARSAILRFLGVESVTVIQVDELPPAATGPAAFGQRTTLAAAGRALGFRPLLPRDLGPPDAVYLDARTGYLIVLYGTPRARLRLAETNEAPGIVKKLTFTRGAEEVSVDGAPGVWLPGPHVVFELSAQPRLSASALLWERGGVFFRLEGRLTKRQALEIARSLR